MYTSVKGQLEGVECITHPHASFLHHQNCDSQSWFFTHVGAILTDIHVDGNGLAVTASVSVVSKCKDTFNSHLVTCMPMF